MSACWVLRSRSALTLRLCATEPVKSSPTLLFQRRVLLSSPFEKGGLRGIFLINFTASRRATYDGIESQGCAAGALRARDVSAGRGGSRGRVAGGRRRGFSSSTIARGACPGDRGHPLALSRGRDPGRRQPTPRPSRSCWVLRPTSSSRS